MGRLFAVKNLGPAPSMEELANAMAQYVLFYEDTYLLKDDTECGQTVEDYVYDGTLHMIADDPRDALVYLTSERQHVCDEGADDDSQIPMLDRLIDMTKAYIAARGL